MNGIFCLSPREAEVFSFILKMDSDWRPRSDSDFKNVLNTSNRRFLVKECNLNKSNLSRMVIDIAEKGLLIKNEHGGYEVPSKIAIEPDVKLIEIVFTLEVDDERTR
jgi:hypothetical protein